MEEGASDSSLGGDKNGMATSSPQEKDMQVNGGVVCRIDFHSADNVHTPVACQKVSSGEGTKGTDPLLNLRFKTEEEAYDCYKDYAEKSGFKIRKSTCNKGANGIVRSRTFCCSRAGFKKDRPDGKGKWRWEDTRTGCTAYVYLKLEKDGMYTITRHRADHNHKCTPNLTQVPDKNLLRSLSKDAKKHTVNNFVIASKDKITTTTRYKNLMRTSVRLSNMAVKNEEAYEMTLDVMNDLMKKLKENYNVAEPPNDIDAELRSEFDIFGMMDDNRILCGNDTASIPSQVMGVGQKEKDSKGGKRKKSALEKASENKSAKAKAPKDSTSRDQPTNAHLPTLSMDQPLMNQQEQHFQASLVLGMRPEMVEPVESALPPDASNSDGFAQANIRMERPPL